MCRCHAEVVKQEVDGQVAVGGQKGSRRLGDLADRGSTGNFFQTEVAVSSKELKSGLSKVRIDLEEVEKTTKARNKMRDSTKDFQIESPMTKPSKNNFGGTMQRKHNKRRSVGFTSEKEPSTTRNNELFKSKDTYILFN